MEPVSFAVGILGLCSLFSTCMDVLKRIDSYKESGLEYRSIIAQLDADKLRFQKWALSVGIHQRDFKDMPHHKDLDDPQTAKVIGNLLSSIREVLHKTESTVSKLQFVTHTNPKTAQGNSPSSQQSIHVQPFPMHFRHKFRWALSGKENLIEQARLFGVLVERLYSLVPLYTATGAASVKLGTGGNLSSSSVDNYILEVQQFSDWQNALNEMLTQVRAEKRKKIDSWLGATSTEDLYDNFLRKRLDSTCDWIQTRPEFIEWMSPDFPSNTAKMLWINGPPGYGKTIICATAIHYLLTTGSPASPLAYYFFSSESESRGDPFIVIRSWLSQVLDCDQNAYQIVCERWQTSEGHTASRTDIMQLFKLVAQSIQNCIFVVDGLDECAWLKDNLKTGANHNPGGFLTSLKEAIIQSTSRVMIVSRDEVDIRSEINLRPTNSPNPTLYILTISPSDVQPDIERFCRSIVNSNLANKSEALKDKLSRKMVERCNGMFLWVKMQADSLRGGKNAKQLERIVDHAPTGLEHLYDRNWMRLSDLPGSDRARAFSILRWAAFALRPLTVVELTEALLLVDDDSYDDLPVDEVPDDIDDEYVNGEIKNLCGSLIEIRRRDPEQDLGSLTVHLTHFSVKQYILCKMSPAALWDMDRLLHSGEMFQSNELAKICLRYLNFGKVWQQPKLSTDSLSSRPFCEYAARFWHAHIMTGCENYADVVSLTNILFDPTNSNWASWQIWFESVEPPLALSRPAEASIASPLYYASLFGLHHTVVYLVEHLRLDVNNVDKHQRTALQAACAGGFISIVEALLAKKANATVATNEGWTPLHIACSKGHAKVVKVLLNIGADPIAKDNDGLTPLFIVSRGGHIEIARMLLEEGADTMATGNDGWTPLHAASTNNHIEIAKMLLEKGANAAAITKEGSTSLHLVASHGYVDLTKLLLENGADATLTDIHGWTPLHLASRNGHVDLAKLLFEKGADATLANIDGWTPLHLASRNGHVDVIKVLFEGGANITVRAADSNFTLLHSACCDGHTQVAKFLFEKGAAATVISRDGWTPLNIASCYGHIELADLLLEKGANLTYATEDGLTPLNLASTNGHVNIVKLLLEKGADVTVANKDGKTPLKSASANGHVDIVKLLLEKGADVTVADKDGWTPLQSASANGHVDIVKLLLEKGADVTVADKDGWTPLQSASANGHVDIVKLLLEKGADVTVATEDGWTPLNLASTNGHADTVKLLLENGADMEIAGKEGWTPLNSASTNGHVDTIKLLLENGADVKTSNKDEWTPLKSASTNGHADIVKLLLENGADVETASKDGWTPLNSASTNGHVDTVKLLLEKGANVKIANKDGWTPLQSASANGHIDIVKLLLKEGAEVEEMDSNRRSALSHAAGNGHDKVVQVLLSTDKVKVDSNDNSGRTPLSHAAEEGHSAVVQLLLQKTINADAHNDHGNTPLSYAAWMGHESVLKLLLAHENVNADSKDEDGDTPLLSAAYKGHQEIIKLLIESGTVDLNSKNNAGRTPLLIAAERGHEAVVQQLLETGKVEVDAKDNNAQTPLLYTAENGHEAITRQLLEKGANIGMENRDGWTALQLAVLNGHEEVEQLLVKHGASEPQDFYGLQRLFFVQ